MIHVPLPYNHHPLPLPYSIDITHTTSTKSVFYRLISYNSDAQNCYVLDCFSSS
ncbi:hypothetical protein BN1323_210097 [Staphylococcus aureus]|nr:hypothetical protein BN1323_210097 [Staphylococcus aureus]CRI24788.1 hypothetical protein SAET23_440097 [Staphylococcus aureus]CRI29581.1 hypothetical protein SAET23_440097 [Staphylococcus aureus]